MMSKRRRYFELLGLPFNASKEEIRKQFRNLAKQYHPDRNKSENATELFQLIKEAYDYLMEETPSIANLDFESTPSEEVKRMERIRKAKERIKAKREADEKIKVANYQKLTSGFQWKIFSVISYMALFSAFVLLIEPILPSHFEKQVVTAYSHEYNGFKHNEVFLIKTTNKLSLFCEQTLHEKLFLNDTIFIQRSFIFHNPTLVFHRSKLGITSHSVDFSVINLFPFVSILFAIPYFVKRRRALTSSYIFRYKFSFYVVESLFLYFLFSQDRWIHLLFIGFL
jgi:hypothetical protein